MRMEGVGGWVVSSWLRKSCRSLPTELFYILFYSQSWKSSLSASLLVLWKCISSCAWVRGLGFLPFFKLVLENISLGKEICGQKDVLRCVNSTERRGVFVFKPSSSFFSVSIHFSLSSSENIGWIWKKPTGAGGYSEPWWRDRLQPIWVGEFLWD